MIKTILEIGAMILFSVIVFDGLIYMFARDLGQKINHAYGYPPCGDERFFGRDYPRHHFTANAKRGFDIAPGVKTLSCKPRETDPYPVWGNELACFDTEKGGDFKPQVYLAGDSMTWGYAPFEKKFGNLLEQNTGLSVLKCGVSHTGQRHQFSKFLDVSAKLERFPEVVIVNYVTNDFANDYAFPHTTVIDGYQVEDTVLVKNQNGNYELQRIDHDTLRHRYNKTKDARLPEEIRFLLRRYSITANLLDKMKDAATKRVEKSVNNQISFYDLIGPLSDQYGRYPVATDYGKPNLQAIKDWHDHSLENGYRLIISLIAPENRIGVDWYVDLEAFLTEYNIEFVNFEDYIVANNLEPRSLFWENDRHLNLEGNAHYATFLAQALASSP